MKKYRSLFKRYPEQKNEDVFAFFPFDGNIESWEAPYEKLAKIASPENWSFSRLEIKEKYKNQSLPILTSYLNYTFLRIQELNFIVYSDEEDKAAFNTGLQTRQGKDIFALFFRNKQSKERDQCDWTFFAFVDSYSEKLNFYPETPKIATYIEDANDLVFDTKLEIDTNLGHIVEKNMDRLPVALRENPRIAITSITGAVQFLRNRIVRNYKVAIPHWYENKIQLLLPLVISNDDNIADLALVVDKDKDRKFYRGKTVLSMDQAYIDARLITRPDSDWLNP
ncbi:MAG: DUF3825 domain-containing protein [Leptospiraceae bacterium]|nr:DUF3825 domain-containing protein [Leptospiraceae bacterium]MCK6605755.1 DUF3825 domain-containing protein [Ignavibacteriaceae bacterium]